MSRKTTGWRLFSIVAGLVAVATGPGCHSGPGGMLSSVSHKPDLGPSEVVEDFNLPKELKKVSLPPYTVEAPDILLINAQRLIPLPPYRVEPLDALYLYAMGAPEQNPINGLYPVDTDGTINLGPTYGGQVKVADMTVTEIEKVLAARLKGFLKEPSVMVSLAQSRGVQQISGEHLVRPDGTVSLGAYGAVYVAGMTLPQVKMAVEGHLSKYLYRPEVTVDVYGYNSKFYYVITDFAGSGEQVARLPVTGNETVLDSIALIGGLSAVSSKTIWVARPAPDGCGDQVLPVDWKGITRRGKTKTNYQLLPGDRVFVMSQPVTKFDTYFARILSPIERGLGITLLGASTARSLGPRGANGGFGGGLFIP